MTDPISSEDHFSSDIFYKHSIPPDKEEARGAKGTSKRIYMNPPRLSKIHYEFGLLFIKKCIRYGIPFDMKLFGASAHNEMIETADGAVFYSRNAYFKKHIEIIEEIFRRYPEFKEYYGSPIATGGNIVDSDGKAYMAICHCGVTTGETYNDTVDRIMKYSFAYSCCQYIINHPSIFATKFDAETMSRIEEIVSSPIDDVTINNMRHVRDGEKKSIREMVGMAIENRRELIEHYVDMAENTRLDTELCEYIRASLPLFKSLITFGDLAHTDVPIYMDKTFPEVRERDKGRVRH